MTKDTKTLMETTPMLHSVQQTWHAHTCPGLRDKYGSDCTCLWIWIERTADPDDDRGPDLYLGPFPAGTEDLVQVTMNESLLVEGELTSHLGGTDCEIRRCTPYERPGGKVQVILVDHDDPIDMGYDRTGTCKHCGHGIVRLASRVDESWIAPDAGYDSVDGDGIWRETCPDNHGDIFAPHEPEES